MLTHPQIAELADLIEAHYVFPDLAGRIAAALRQARPQTQTHAEALNLLLHRLSADRHLLLRPAPQFGQQDEPAADGGVGPPYWLGDSVAVLRIGPFFAGPGEALAPLDVALAETVDALDLVFDLRGCHGGDPALVPHLMGRLLADRAVHLGTFVHRSGLERPVHTIPAVPSVGSRVKVWALTSSQTFSGGEDIAYAIQQSGRGTVIGEVTGGGAHPVDHFPLSAGRVVQIPTARYVSAFTGSSWEQVGVRPDVPCPASKALQRLVSGLAS